MNIKAVSATITQLIPVLLLAACASSEVDKFSVAEPETIITDIKVEPSKSDPRLYTFTGPTIDVRAGYGGFAKGMLGGGSDFGNSIALQGSQVEADEVTHRIVATVQYTNIGGAFRVYNRAGIEGVGAATIESFDREKQFTASGVIMTETVGIEISDAVLRSHQDADIVLRLGTDSGKLVTQQIPKNYIIAYLRAVDRQTRADTSH